jgi:hypothetical protein
MELIIGVVKPNGLPSAPTFVRDVRVWIIFAIALLGIAIGTWGGFPVFDDASLLLLWIEKGPGTLLASNLHRPIVGFLLQLFVDNVGINKLPYVLINLAFWSVFSWQTFLISRRLFPERAAATLAALLVLSPIIVKTHFTTINTLFPDNLPVLITLSVLLLSLRQNIRTFILLTAALLSVAASAMSEYGVAASAASFVLLIILRKNRCALAILIGTAIGYLIYQSTANFQYRPTRSIGTQIEMLSSRGPNTITHLVHALWTAFVGAYGRALGNFSFDADSASTVVAAVFGVAAAVLIFLSFKKNPEEIPNKASETLAVILAVVAGLMPVTLANQSPSGGDSYETRFFIPVLPFATIITSRMILYFTRDKLRPVAAAILTFICICTVFNSAFEFRREQKDMESFGKVLRPIVESSSAMTIVVVPDHEKLDGSDITPKIVLHWPRELLPKVWIITAAEIIRLNGPRTNCNSVTFDLPRELLSAGRKGAISNLYFFPDFWQPKGQISTESVEPYCIHERSNSK